MRPSSSSQTPPFPFSHISVLSSHQICFPRWDLKAYNKILRSHTLWATLKLKPWVRDSGITSMELMNLKKSGFHSLLLSQPFMLLITYPLFSITRNYIARKKITYFIHLLKTNLSRKAKMLSFFFKDFTIVQGQMTKAFILLWRILTLTPAPPRILVLGLLWQRVS